MQYPRQVHAARDGPGLTPPSAAHSYGPDDANRFLPDPQRLPPHSPGRRIHAARQSPLPLRKFHLQRAGESSRCLRRFPLRSRPPHANRQQSGRCTLPRVSAALADTDAAKRTLAWRSHRAPAPPGPPMPPGPRSLLRSGASAPDCRTVSCLWEVPYGRKQPQSLPNLNHPSDLQVHTVRAGLKEHHFLPV